MKLRYCFLRFRNENVEKLSIEDAMSLVQKIWYTLYNCYKAQVVVVLGCGLIANSGQGKEVKGQKWMFI